MSAPQNLLCIEIYIYQLKSGSLDKMMGIKDQLIREAHSLDGLISSTTFQSAKEPDIFTDQMIWRDLDSAIAGSEAFRKLPSSKHFMSLLANPPTGGRFYHLAGDMLGKL